MSQLFHERSLDAVGAAWDVEHQMDAQAALECVGQGALGAQAVVITLMDVQHGALGALDVQLLIVAKLAALLYVQQAVLGAQGV